MQNMAAPLNRTPTVDAEKENHSSSSSITRQDDGLDAEPVVQEKSRGVLKMELLSSRINTKYLVLLYGGFALLAYVMSLDQYTSSAYLFSATSVSFAAHSTLATIRTIKSVFQAVSQPPIAKIADVFGRIEAYCLCVFLYALGYAIAAASNSIYVYAVGNSIYILGITGLFLLQNIIIADISSLRNRLFWSIFPSLPGTINVWVSGNVSQSFLSHSSWRWGLGMFAILTPALATPIILTLTIGMRKHKKASALSSIQEKPVSKSRKTKRNFKLEFFHVFWQLDLIGLVLLVSGAGLVLVTVTIANGRGSKWSDTHCIVMLVVGGLCSIGFVAWERFGARHPLIPFNLLTNRTVIACMFIAIFHPVAGGVVGGYFYTFLLVAANQSVKSATRITNIASFTGTLSAVFAGVVARYIRHLKPIILFGFSVEVLGLGLMIHYRQSTNSQFVLAIVQVVRGLGVGCIGFPVQAAIQSAAKHEHTAAITAGYLTIYYLAGGVGSAIGGGIWTNRVPQKLAQYMPTQALAIAAYTNPQSFILKYAPGTVERIAVARAHDEVQRTIVTVGTIIAAFGLLTAFFIENVKLTDTQSLPELEDEPQGSSANKVNHESLHQAVRPSSTSGKLASTWPGQ